MKRVIAMLAVGAVALVAGGCGGSDSGSSPLDGALSYLPKDTPYAAAIDTNVSGGQYKALDEALGKFPLSDQIKQQILKSIEANGTSFEKDIKPQLGNPAVVGGGSAKSVTDNADSNDEFIAAFQAKDKDALDGIVKKRKPKEQGEHDGTKLYNTDSNSWLAVDDDFLVTASSKALLEKALDAHGGDDHFSEDEFNDGLEGLPKDALARIYVDIQGLLKSDPDTADAQRVKWVGALRTLGITAQAREDALHFDFNMKTEGDLSDADLPLAPGDEAPEVLNNKGEVGFGLRNPAQVFKFGESAAQAVNPQEFGQYAAAKRQIEQRYKIDLDTDVIDQFSGDTAFSVGVDGKYGVRSELKDPAAFKKTLAKLADLIPTFARGAGAGNVAIAKPKKGSDFYALADPNGNTIVFGVVNDVFVLANDPTRAGRLASEKPVAVPSAKGAFAMNADAEQLVRAIYTRAAPSLGFGGNFGIGLFVAPLNELNASVADSTDGMRGSFELSLD